MPPGVPTRPAGGGNVASAWGQWAHDWLQGRNVIRATSNLTLSTSYQDIAGATITLPAGWYIFLAIVDAAITSAGVGEIDCVLNINGTDQQGLAVWQPASASTGEGTVAQIWIAQLVSTQVCKLRAKKSIAAGTAIILSANTSLAVI